MNTLRRIVLVALLALLVFQGAPTNAQRIPTETQRSVDPEALFVPVDRQRQAMLPAQAEAIARVQAAPGVINSQLGRINLQRLKSGQPFSLQLFNEKVRFTTTRLEEQPLVNGYSWVGTSADAQTTASIVFDDTNLSGTIITGRNTYTITSLGDGLHTALQIDTAALPTLQEDGIKLETGGTLPQEDGKAPNVQDSANALPTAAQVDSGAETTILVAYTPGAGAKMVTPELKIQEAVNQANEIYARSGITLRLRLVFVYQTSYTASGNVSTDLARWRTLSDGYMDEVHRYRNYAGADVAILMVDQGQCGVAYINAIPSTAFGVVLDSCATTDFSFTHEIGHIQGADHDVKYATGINTQPYARGYQYQGAPAWRTVMSYQCPNVACPRIKNFSNPNIYYNGLPTGTVSTHNNARVLNERAQTVANFRTLPEVYCNGRRANLVGTAGNDQILGTLGNDVMVGLGGNDEMHGRPGDDLFCGNDGNDVLIGAKGNDLLIGEIGDDTLFGNEGDDTLQGGLGIDTLHGGKNNDRLYGGDGNDTLNGDLDIDYLDGGTGVDNCYTGESKVACEL